MIGQLKQLWRKYRPVFAYRLDDKQEEYLSAARTVERQRKELTELWRDSRNLQQVIRRLEEKYEALIEETTPPPLFSYVEDFSMYYSPAHRAQEVEITLKPDTYRVTFRVQEGLIEQSSDFSTDPPEVPVFRHWADQWAKDLTHNMADRIYDGLVDGLRLRNQP